MCYSDISENQLISNDIVFCLKNKFDDFFLLSVYYYLSGLVSFVRTAGSAMPASSFPKSFRRIGGEKNQLKLRNRLNYYYFFYSFPRINSTCIVYRRRCSTTHVSRDTRDHVANYLLARYEKIKKKSNPPSILSYFNVLNLRFGRTRGRVTNSLRSRRSSRRARPLCSPWTRKNKISHYDKEFCSRSMSDGF